MVDDVAAFRDIPFSASPVGDLRWREPQPLSAWSEIRQSVGNPPSCPQKRGLSLEGGGDAPSGDVDGHRQSGATDGATEPVIDHLDIGLGVVDLQDLQRRRGNEVAGRYLGARFVGQQRSLGIAMLDKPTRNRVAAWGRQGRAKTSLANLHPSAELRVGQRNASA